MARVSIFLIIAALIAGTIECAPAPIARYNLTISSTGGGSVTLPGEGTFTYDAGTVVDLVAEAEEGCKFVEWTGDVAGIADVNSASTTVAMNGDYSVAAVFDFEDVGKWTNIVGISAGAVHIVGLRDDGRVVAAGGNFSWQMDTSGWRDMVQVAAGTGHTVGLRIDGGVVVAGTSHQGSLDVSGWTDIVEVAAGARHTVGVRADGSVVAVGNNWLGQCEVENWTGIEHVAAGLMHTVGLRDDGRVVGVGWNIDGQLDVSHWHDIVQIAAGHRHTVGLKADGSVVAAGSNYYGQCNVGGWTDIVQVAAGRYHTVGLRADGSVVAVGNNYHGQLDVGQWTNIVEVAAGTLQTVGLDSGGTVVVAGYKEHPEHSIYYQNVEYGNVKSCEATPGDGGWTEPVLSYFWEIGVLEITVDRAVERVEFYGSGCVYPVTLTCNGVMREVSYYHDWDPHGRYGCQSLIFDMESTGLIVAYTTIHTDSENHGFMIEWIRVYYASP